MNPNDNVPNVWAFEKKRYGEPLVQEKLKVMRTTSFKGAVGGTAARKNDYIIYQDQAPPGVTGSHSIAILPTNLTVVRQSARFPSSVSTLIIAEKNSGYEPLDPTKIAMLKNARRMVPVSEHLLTDLPSQLKDHSWNLTHYWETIGSSKFPTVIDMAYGEGYLPETYGISYLAAACNAPILGAQHLRSYVGKKEDVVMGYTPSLERAGLRIADTHEKMIALDLTFVDGDEIIGENKLWPVMKGWWMSDAKENYAPFKDKNDMKEQQRTCFEKYLQDNPNTVVLFNPGPDADFFFSSMTGGVVCVKDTALITNAASRTAEGNTRQPRDPGASIAVKGKHMQYATEKGMPLVSSFDHIRSSGFWVATTLSGKSYHVKKMKGKSHVWMGSYTNQVDDLLTSAAIFGRRPDFDNTVGERPLTMLGSDRGKHTIPQKLASLDTYGARNSWYVDKADLHNGALNEGESMHVENGPATATYSAFSHADKPHFKRYAVNVDGTEARHPDTGVRYAIVGNTSELTQAFRDALLWTQKNKAPSSKNNRAFQENTVPSFPLDYKTAVTEETWNRKEDRVLIVPAVTHTEGIKGYHRGVIVRSTLQIRYVTDRIYGSEFKESPELIAAHVEFLIGVQRDAIKHARAYGLQILSDVASIVKAGTYFSVGEDLFTKITSVLRFGQGVEQGIFTDETDPEEHGTSLSARSFFDTRRSDALTTSPKSTIFVNPYKSDSGGLSLEKDPIVTPGTRFGETVKYTSAFVSAFSKAAGKRHLMGHPSLAMGIISYGMAEELDYCWMYYEGGWQLAMVAVESAHGESTYHITTGVRPLEAGKNVHVTLIPDEGDDYFKAGELSKANNYVQPVRIWHDAEVKYTRGPHRLYQTSVTLQDGVDSLNYSDLPIMYNLQNPALMLGLGSAISSVSSLVSGYARDLEVLEAEAKSEEEYPLAGHALSASLLPFSNFMLLMTELGYNAITKESVYSFPTVERVGKDTYHTRTEYDNAFNYVQDHPITPNHFSTMHAEIGKSVTKMVF